MATAGTTRWRGIFTIPVTPFHDDGELDGDSLRRELDFCYEAKAHGIVYPVAASEFFVLSDDERMQIIPLAVKQVAGRTPVMIGVSAPNAQSAVKYAKAARDAGADAVIAMPPYVTKFAPDDVFRYFEAVSNAAQIPVCIQNAPISSVPQPLLLRLVREIEHVHYVKEEVPPGHHNVARLAEVGEPRVWGIFGGGGCSNLIDELNRGACGNMPAAEFTDVDVDMMNRWDSGDKTGARALHARMLPAFQRERLNGTAFCKEVLVRRGVIKTARTRGAGTTLDKYDHAELDALWPSLEALFTWKG
jgi:4-hydroxy-tetrahydrodipicolinate synthase